MMIYHQPGEEFWHEGVCYKVGGRIVANEASDYAGLFGNILEIRTEDDRETDNDTPDIYCAFEAPVLSADRLALEQTFSQLYREQKHIEDLGLDMYDVHSVRFQFVYTEEQKKANRRAHTAADEGQALVMAAEVRNSIMEPVMDAIAQNFVCYQYEDTEPAPFGSCQWDLFFWCNDFSNTLHGCGLSGRDYSYFTLSFNENQTVEKRAEVCWRLLQFLEHRCRKNRNLDAAVQYSIWYDHEKIEKDADRMKCLLAGCSCTYSSKDGKFLFDNGIFCFRPKYAKRQLYRVSDSEVLALCWKLGLTDDASDGGPLATGRCSA